MIEFPVVMIHKDDLEMKEPLVINFTDETTGHCIHFAESKHNWIMYDLNIEHFEEYKKVA